MRLNASTASFLLVTGAYLLNGNHDHGSGYSMQDWLLVVGGIGGLLVVIALVWLLSVDTVDRRYR